MDRELVVARAAYVAATTVVERQQKFDEVNMKVDDGLSTHKEWRDKREKDDL